MFKVPFFLNRSEIYWWKWLMNFSGKLPSYATLFGITQDTVDEITKNAAALDFVMATLVKLKSTVTTWVEVKDWLFGFNSYTGPVKLPKLPVFTGTAPAEVISGIMDLPIAVGISISKSPYATPEILSDLALVPWAESGIEVPEENRKPRQEVVRTSPLLKSKVEGDKITIRVVRGTPFKGFNACLYANKDGTGHMTLLNVTNGNQFIDKAVFPENVDTVVYAYQVQCKNGDTVVGDPSEVLLVPVKRPLGI